MSVAITMTVRDERAVLRTNLQYHHFLGVDVVYLYDDGSTDGTAETVADLPYVQVRSSVGIADVPDWPQLAEARSQFSTFFVARQMLNISHSMQLARAAGIDWLLQIDADELAVVNIATPDAGSLRRVLDAMPRSAEQAIFRPLEAVQRHYPEPDVMATETMFKRVDRNVTRKTLDPFTHKMRDIRVIYGHTSGKAAMRLSVEAYPVNSHRFTDARGKRVRQADAGYLLHYFAPDFESFVHKFRTIKDHPDRQLQGRETVLQKRLWRDVVNHMDADESQLRAYYDQWVAFSDEDIDRMSKRSGFMGRTEPLIVEVTSARDVIKTITSADAAPLDSGA